MTLKEWLLNQRLANHPNYQGWEFTALANKCSRFRRIIRHIPAQLIEEIYRDNPIIFSSLVFDDKNAYLKVNQSFNEEFVWLLETFIKLHAIVVSKGEIK